MPTNHQDGTLPNVPLIFVGHSRGAKLCVLAAERVRRKVSAMILIDPVDATAFETVSVFPSLKYVCHVCMYACMYVCMHACMLCMYVCMYVMYV